MDNKKHALEGFNRYRREGLECPLDYTHEEYAKVNGKKRDTVGRTAKFFAMLKDKTSQLYEYLNTFAVKAEKEDDKAFKPKRIPWEIEPLLFAIDECEKAKIKASNKDEKGKVFLPAKALEYYRALHKKEGDLLSVYRNTDKFYQQVISMDLGSRFLGDKLAQLMALIVLCDPQKRPEILYSAGDLIDELLMRSIEQMPELCIADRCLANVFEELAKQYFSNCDLEESASSMFNILINDRYSVVKNDIPAEVLNMITDACSRDKKITKSALEEARKLYDSFRANAQNGQLREKASRFGEEINKIKSLTMTEEVFSAEKEREFLECHIISELYKSGFNLIQMKLVDDYEKNSYRAFLMGLNRGLNLFIDAKLRELIHRISGVQSSYYQLTVYKIGESTICKLPEDADNSLINGLNTFFRGNFISACLWLFRWTIDAEMKIDYEEYDSESVYMYFSKRYLDNDCPDKDDFSKSLACVIYVDTAMKLDIASLYNDMHSVEKAYSFSYKLLRVSVGRLVKMSIDDILSYRDTVVEKRKELISFLKTEVDPHDHKKIKTLYESISDYSDKSLSAVFTWAMNKAHEEWLSEHKD